VKLYRDRSTAENRSSYYLDIKPFSLNSKTQAAFCQDTALHSRHLYPHSSPHHTTPHHSTPLHSTSDANMQFFKAIVVLTIAALSQAAPTRECFQKMTYHYIDKSVCDSGHGGSLPLLYHWPL
jgi:hypothetical protein